jgi:hypothetical protein
MRYFLRLIVILIIMFVLTNGVNARERAISEKELHDKISAFWLGQLVGNYFGLPFENKYVDEPVPFLVDRVYTFEDDETLNLNRRDWRGFIPIFMDAVEGAFADDDTDISGKIRSRYYISRDHRNVDEAHKPKNLGGKSYSPVTYEQRTRRARNRTQRE